MSALARFVRLKVPSEREPEDLPQSSLSHGLAVVGILDCDGVLRIHGAVRGRINATQLVIERDGYVEGDIVAQEVLIGGRLVGRVFAPTVTVDASADIDGRIFHNTVSIAPGAKFEGRMPWRPPSYFETLDQLPEVQA